MGGFIDYLPMKTIIYRGFPIAAFDYRRVYINKYRIFPAKLDEIPIKMANSNHLVGLPAVKGIFVKGELYRFPSFFNRSRSRFPGDSK